MRRIVIRPTLAVGTMSAIFRSNGMVRTAHRTLVTPGHYVIVPTRVVRKSQENIFYRTRFFKDRGLSRWPELPKNQRADKAVDE